MLRYPLKLTDKDILWLLRNRVYEVDTEQGIVYGYKKKPLSQFADKDGQLFVFLHYNGWTNGGRKGISVAKLVWMAKTNRRVPKGFEIHHRNLIKEDNTWNNLFALYSKDHKKLHGGRLDEPFTDQVPF